MVGEFFKLKDIPEIEVIEESVFNSEIESLKNCVPLDKDLKYQTLFYPNQENLIKPPEKMPELKIIPVTKSEKGEPQKSDTNKQEEDIEKFIENLHKSLLEKKSAKYDTLLYKEICREIENGRK